MTLRGMRLGFFAFLLLTSGFAGNLMMFQPSETRTAVTRAAPAVPQSEIAGTIATGSVVLLNANAGQKAKAASAEPAAAKTSESPEVVRAVQRELQARGYETGSADGTPGLVTRAAIMAYQADHALPLTGLPSDSLLQNILLGSPGGRTKTASTAEPSPEAEQLIRTVQQSLTSLGYAPGTIDGRLGAETVRTIRDFETDQGLPQSGRISGQLVARLARLAGQGRLADGR